MTGRVAIAAALLALAACVPEEGPMMAPGDDCLDCHGGGEAKAWTAAGTLGVRGVSEPLPGQRGSSITLTDAAGRSITIRANQAGNFYTAERMAFPLKVAVDGQTMTAQVTDGSCNRCHGHGPGSGGGGD